MKKKTIYLADLTHTCQSVASNVFPLGIGLLASYMNLHNKDKYRIELFKYPEDLNKALTKGMPEVMGFSNYSWNVNISSEYARKIKASAPETTIVFGGPNYGLSQQEIRAFWTRYPWIDFHVVKEGEKALDGLLALLDEFDFNTSELKSARRQIASCHYLQGGDIIEGPLLPRIQDLREVGSPYTQGLMDKFFDDVLIPMVHTTRGCPFTCTFCTEGSSYYSKVAQHSQLKQFEDELTYIAKRVGSIQWLWLTDANFGMYKEDREKAQIIAKLQKEYSWPKRVWGATGKKMKERVIEVASILNGALTVFASLQTTNARVLQNIKRTNISSDALNEIVLKSERANSETVTELILGLPGDTVETHTQSLKDTLDANLGNIRMYQMILLPQTEMCSPESRERYGLKTKFRIQQRSFGRYPYLDKKLIAVESEEITIATNTLSFDDYLKCREIDFTVEILHNTGIFTELMGLCRWAGMSWFEFIYGAYKTIRASNHELNGLYDRFRADTVRWLWDSAAELEAHAAAHIDELLSDEGGTNEIVKNKALAFLSYQDQLHDIVYCEMEKALRQQQRWGECLQTYLSEIKELSLKRKQNFLQRDVWFTSKLHFDYEKLRESQFRLNPEETWSPEPVTVRIEHTDEQKQAIDSYINQYSRAVEGMGRILMRAPVRRLYRSVECV